MGIRQEHDCFHSQRNPKRPHLCVVEVAAHQNDATSTFELNSRQGRCKVVPDDDDGRRRPARRGAHRVAHVVRLDSRQPPPVDSGRPAGRDLR